MEKIRLPAGIEKEIRGECFREETIGASGARVLIGEETVLKIGPAGEETGREARILAWLEGKLSAPRLLAREEAEGMAYTLMTRVKGRMLCDPCYLRDSRLLTRFLALAL